MRTIWLLLMAIGLLSGTLVPASAQIFFRGAFNLAEAYPCTIQSYDPAAGITTPRVFRGRGDLGPTDPECPPGETLSGALPGILSLTRRGTGLDVNCFAVVPFNEVGPCVVQSYRLTKKVPGSYKCPDVYGIPRGGTRYHQFGSTLRTWWSLNFTQPGTEFMLEVDSVCRRMTAEGIGDPRLHRDVWIWRVVADVETLRYVIELMHGGAVSTLEVPCILGEDLYDALLQARQRLADALRVTGDQREGMVGSAIFDMEALIVTNCLFTEVLNPVLVFPGPDQFGAPNLQPPGNLALTVFVPGSGTAVAGIIDTIENPCCCKLIVDLEWIAFREGIDGPQPPLLTF